MEEILEQQQRQQAASMSADQAKTRQASMDQSLSNNRQEMRDTLNSLRDVGAERADGVKDAVESVYGGNSEEARAAENARTAQEDSVGRAKDVGDDFMRKMQESLDATKDPDRKRELEKAAGEGRDAIDKFARDIEAKSRETAGQAYGQDNVAQTLNAAADAFREREQELEKQLEELSPDRSLDVKYSEPGEFETKDGEKRVEQSAEALLRHDDDKLNPRHDPELNKADRQLREKVGGDGRDATHLFAAMFGANPDERNLVAFNHVMNRDEMQKWEKDTEARRKAGEDLHVKVTAIFKADSEGKRAGEPIAIRAERENRKTGERDSMTFGNFSSAAMRAADQAREQGRQLTADERNRANRESSALNRENKAAERERQRDAGQERAKPELRVVQNDGDERERERAEERRTDEQRENRIDEERRQANDRERQQQEEQRQAEERERERLEQRKQEEARQEERRREAAEQEKREAERREREREERRREEERRGR
jgi:hypothetical protein